MTTTMCNQCATPLKNSKYYDVIYRDATTHEEKKKKVEEIEEADEEEIKKIEDEKKKMIEELKNALRKLTSEELDDEIIRLSEELDEIKKKLNPDKEEKDKDSRRAEFIGLEAPAYKTKKYSVLQLKQFDHNTAPGDKLLMRLGSRDDDSIGDSSGDELLKKLGSVD